MEPKLTWGKGGGNISRHREPEDLETFISRVCGQSKRLGILSKKAWLHKGGDLMPQYTGLSGVNIRHWRRRGCQCWCEVPSLLSCVSISLTRISRMIAINYRLKSDDLAYIFDHAEVQLIIVDAEFVPFLDAYHKTHPDIPFLIDTDTDATVLELSGSFDEAVLEGLKIDSGLGSQGWMGLQAQTADERAMIALAYTSGTTARPKGVEYTHRGAYLAALGNVIESELNCQAQGRCRYLWTLPMFHAMGTVSSATLTPKSISN